MAKKVYKLENWEFYYVTSDNVRTVIHTGMLTHPLKSSHWTKLNNLYKSQEVKEFGVSIVPVKANSVS